MGSLEIDEITHGIRSGKQKKRPNLNSIDVIYNQQVVSWSELNLPGIFQVNSMKNKYNKQIQIFKNRENTNLKMTSSSQIDSSDVFQPRCFRTKQKVYHRWTLEENQKYITFLDMAKEDFETEYTRRVKKVFKNLSIFMETKSESQCKSHHQKMMQQHETIDNIILFLGQKINSKGNKDEESEMKDEKQKTQSRRRIKRVFKKLFEFIIVNQQKRTKKKLAVVKLISYLSRAIQRQMSTEGIQPDLLSKKKSFIEENIKEFSVENFFNQRIFEDDIYNVLDL